MRDPGHPEQKIFLSPITSFLHPEQKIEDPGMEQKIQKRSGYHIF